LVNIKLNTLKLVALCISANLKINTSKNVAFSGVSKVSAVSLTKITEISQVDPELAGSRE